MFSKWYVFELATGVDSAYSLEMLNSFLPGFWPWH
jgi:hypothetical protein